MAQIEIKALAGVGIDPAQIERLKKVEEAVRNDMSKPGKLGLPPLLEQRRFEHSIPDSAFKYQPLFDRIFVWPVPDDHGLLSKDSPLVLPETVRQRDMYSTPRGVLIAAGLGALDVMHSHGVELGHMIHFQRIAPFKRRIGRYAGEEMQVWVLQIGDLASSEDLAAEIRAGSLKVEPQDDNGSVQYRVVDKKGRARTPKTPWISPDQT
jgi:hypothetical protein